MGYSRNSDQVTDRAMRPGMEPAVNSTVKIPGYGVGTRGCRLSRYFKHQMSERASNAECDPNH